MPIASDIDLSKLGKRLYTTRKQRGLTLQQVAQRLGNSGHTHISHLENGMAEPSLSMLHRLADVYECRVYELIPPDLFSGH